MCSSDLIHDSVSPLRGEEEREREKGRERERERERGRGRGRESVCAAAV